MGLVYGLLVYGTGASNAECVLPVRRLKLFLANAMASRVAFFLAGFGVTICVPFSFDFPR